MAIDLKIPLFDAQIDHWHEPLAELLQDCVQRDIKTVQLEAELVQCRNYLEKLRISVHYQERGEKSP